MQNALILRNRNYRLLLSAGALTNLGDGIVALALPWLATLLTRDALAVSVLTAAGYLPWLLFALPAGVLTDRADRRQLVLMADLLRCALVLGIAGLALAGPREGALAVFALLSFLLGSAKVLRDNAAQTMLPAIVPPQDLESANGQLWSAEQLMGQMVGPALAGVLIGLGVAVPFGTDAALLACAATLLALIVLPRQPSRPPQAFWAALMEGVQWMRRDAALLRLACVLGLTNFLWMACNTLQVLLAQEVLGLNAAQFGMVLSAGALGAVAGSLGAPLLVRRFGVQCCLLGALLAWALGYAAMGMAPHGVGLALALAGIMAGAMVWNVITVSWRQRRIAPALLGRVNSIYRCFGWGSMPLGALAAGALVVALEQQHWSRESALRAPFLCASVLALGLAAYAWARLRLD